MLLDVRPHSRLRGARAVNLNDAVLPVLDAVTASDVDLSRVRVVADWVQYRDNFRGVVQSRRIGHATPDTGGLPPPEPLGVRDDDLEIAVDLRRSGSVRPEELHELTAAALSATGDDLPLEDWGPGSRSCVWDFNALYWSALELWEKSTGRGYEQALPGGESDARNTEAARELILELFGVWDRLVTAQALPDELYVLEIGVGNGGQAKVFLDEFARLDQERGSDYYRRLHYLMCDYSAHVLELARQAVAEHAEQVSSFTLDATRPCTALGFLKYKIFLVYVSNVYDNLPTDEVAQLGGRTYQVEIRAQLCAADAAELAGSIGIGIDRLPDVVHRLLRLGPSLLADAMPDRFPDTGAAVDFWRRAWAAVRLDERYVPLAGLDTYDLGGGTDLGGELLRPLLESGADVRMHVNNGALQSFVDSLRLLHPYGRLVCHDLFVTEIEGYRTHFRGPGKYDGSVVNWVNGPLLAHVGRRRGFDVRYERFRHRAGGGNIVTMTAQARD